MPSLYIDGEWVAAAAGGSREIRSPFDSSLYITWIVPSLGSWNDKADHTILCVLGRKDGGQLDKSAKDLKI